MLVLNSTRSVVEAATQVTIDDAAIEAWARGLLPGSIDPSGHDLLEHIPGTREEIANLILLIDALNFCFWSPNPIRIQWRGRSGVLAERRPSGHQRPSRCSGPS